MRKQLENVGFVKQTLALVQEYENLHICDDCRLIGSNPEQFIMTDDSCHCKHCFDSQNKVPQ